MQFRTPFHVEQGVIFDSDGRKVKLWGVNYYVPFNHNYCNIEELGKDHFAAIDEDLRHFEMLGVDFIRMHLYDREISDPHGNIVENHQMEVFDYLVEETEKRGIYLMITPIVWWNTVKNQLQMDREYAYWHIGSGQAFGFSNFYSKDGLLWDTEALECQKRYFRGLFARKNHFSGKRLDEYSNIAAIELCNEMDPPNLWMLNDPDTFDKQGFWQFSHGEQLRKLIGIWEEYKAGKKGTDAELLDSFNCELLERYGRTMLAVVDEFFQGRVLRGMFGSYNGILQERQRDLFSKLGIELPTFGTYLNADNFDSTNTDRVNHLAMAQRWYEDVKLQDYGNFGKVVYEFDATGTQNGYPCAAMAAAYAKFGVQMAAYFTYTPAAVAAWNPGWLVHYLSLPHTPRKAAAFAAAGALFRSNSPETPLTMEEGQWTGKDYKIVREGDCVVYRDAGKMIFSNSDDTEPTDRDALAEILGHGTGTVAACDGNGCYYLKKSDDKTWKLVLFPDQKYLRDPARGKIYRGMANRYISCLTEPPVSQLMERKIRFEFRLAKVRTCLSADGVSYLPDDCGNGTLTLPAGSYTLFCE